MNSPQNATELRAWFAENPDLDPTNPDVTSTSQDKRTYELHTFRNNQTNESKTIQWPCSYKVNACPGCEGLLCRSPHPD
jgi:hypothetical protein